MPTTPEVLPDNVEQLQQLLLLERQQSADKDSQIAQLQQQYQHMLEQFRLAQQRQFGRSSEASADQLGLFNESEQLTEEAAEEAAPERETLTYTRNKPKRKPLPKNLPRETVVHDIAEADKVCDCCGGELHKIGEDSSEQLEFIPASIKVIEHVRPKYGCRHCEQHGTSADIKTAPPPPTPIPKSIATTSLLSQVITANAARQQRYRQRRSQKVTDQGSPPAPGAVSLSLSVRSPVLKAFYPLLQSAWRTLCHFCHRQVDDFVRTDFLHRSLHHRRR